MLHSGRVQRIGSRLLAMYGRPLKLSYFQISLQNQWNQQQGKCGLCGDPFQWERRNEAGGVYATGTIVQQYNSGSNINVTVEVTANHKGWHEFRLCKNDDPSRLKYILS